MPDFPASATVPLTLPVEQYRQTRYRCPYCRRSWVSLKRANEHRDGCWYNRGCKSCRHAVLAAGVWVDGCRVGIDLWDFGAERNVPRSSCPLWEAIEAESMAIAEDADEH